MPLKRMIVDTANLLFRVAAANQGKQGARNGDAPEDIAGLAMHISLNSLNKYYKQYRPDQLAVTFEGFNNWRKEYTKSPSCVSKKIYKANRVKDPSMVPFFELIAAFEKLARDHTSLVCLSHPRLEGDDLIAGYVQKFSAVGDEVIVISGDRDFVQLLKHPNVKLVNPDEGKLRECADPAFYMFEKCFRGDPGDNVISALPRVRKTLLEKAYKDEYELTNLMNRTWKLEDPETQQEHIYKVGDLFIENNLLMNLDCQPPEIRAIIDEVIEHEVQHHGKFSFFHFMKFLGKYDLKKIAENSQSYVDMFSVTGMKSPHRHEEQNQQPLALAKEEPKPKKKSNEPRELITRESLIRY